MHLRVTQVVAGVEDSPVFRQALATAVTRLSAAVTSVGVDAVAVGADGRLTVGYTVTLPPPPDAFVAVLTSAKGVMGVMRDLQGTFPAAALAPPTVTAVTTAVTSATTALTSTPHDLWSGALSTSPTSTAADPYLTSDPDAHPTGGKGRSERGSERGGERGGEGEGGGERDAGNELDGWFGIEDMYQQKRPHEMAFLPATAPGPSLAPHARPLPPPPRYRHWHLSVDHSKRVL